MAVPETQEKPKTDPFLRQGKLKVGHYKARWAA